MHRDQRYPRMSAKAALQYDEVSHLPEVKEHLDALLVTAKMVYPDYTVQHLTQYLGWKIEEQCLSIICEDQVNIQWNPLVYLDQSVQLQKVLRMGVVILTNPPTITTYVPTLDKPLDCGEEWSVLTLNWNGIEVEYFKKLKEIIFKTALKCHDRVWDLDPL